MPLLEYQNLSLMKPFFSWSCSDVIGTETVEVSLAVLEVILVS